MAGNRWNIRAGTLSAGLAAVRDCTRRSGHGSRTGCVPAGTLAHVEAVASAQVNGYDIKIVKVQAEFCAALAES